MRAAAIVIMALILTSAFAHEVHADRVDCADFQSRRIAQLWFDEQGFGPGYDPYTLDEDNDGEVCEAGVGGDHLDDIYDESTYTRSFEPSSKSGSDASSARDHDPYVSGQTHEKEMRDNYLSSIDCNNVEYGYYEQCISDNKYIAWFQRQPQSIQSILGFFGICGVVMVAASFWEYLKKMWK